jgi:hypothetical protein
LNKFETSSWVNLQFLEFPRYQSYSTMFLICISPNVIRSHPSRIKSAEKPLQAGKISSCSRRHADTPL